MRMLNTFDMKNYQPTWRRRRRYAVRAILPIDKKILLVRSSSNGFYKFPGGGIEQNESHMDTLIRETREETGLVVIPGSIRPYGAVREIRKSVYGKREIFDHSSYYYFAKTQKTTAKPSLEDYEAEHGFELVCLPVAAAFEENKKFIEGNQYPFLAREVFILETLLAHAAFQ